METKTSFTDKATTVIGIVLILWVISIYTYSMISSNVSLDWKMVAGFIGLAVFLIIFKGSSARNLFTSIVNRIIPEKKK